MCFYTDEQKANGKAIIFVGYDSQLEAHAIDLRCAKSGHVTKMSKADYSAKLTTSLIKIKTLAVREAGAMDPDLAFDLLRQTLRRSGGNKKRAADLLGIKRTTFTAKLRSLETVEEKT